MKKAIFVALVISSSLTSATVAMAQDKPAETASSTTPTAPAVDTTAIQNGSNGVDDIIVTARRDSENVQHVPVSVVAISGDTLKKLSVNDITEVSKLAPGLTLSSDSAGSGQTQKIVLRGISWQPGSGTPATPIYLNEAPFDPAQTLQSIFDVGQLEVLRGPQGTSRGAPSISGAITITTRRPDLDEFGGYLQGQYGEGKHSDFQGAINVPIIKDVLAIRAAANIEDSQGNRVFSIHNSLAPKFRSRVYRMTVLFKPTDTLTIQAMEQYRDQIALSYPQVVGTGSPGLAAAGIPVNFNGPALSVADRKSVADQPSTNYIRGHLITLNANWEVLGHTLTYNFGRQISTVPTSSQAIIDQGNLLPGFEPFNQLSNFGTPLFQTQEVRVSSIHSEDRPFDYDIGWFQKKSGGPINFVSPVFLTGAFGAPGTPPGAVTTPVSRYVLTASSRILLGQQFDSFYGNVRFYLGAKTEISGGLSVLRDRIPVRLDVTTGAASTVAATLSSLGGLPCAGIPGVFVTGLVPSNYAGFCDFNIAAGASNSTEIHNDKYSHALYNFSLSHRFTDDVLVYATTGTSFRTGLPAINNTGLPSSLLVPKPEKATSYEVGIKTSFGRRLRINADIFQINYKDQLTSFEGVQYYNAVAGRTALTSVAFYRNIDARVRGAELEISAKPIDRLSLGVNASYSKITSQGGSVPCNVGPALTAVNPINFCASPVGEQLNTQSPFQATANGSYDVPINATFDGYFRFNVSYQGKNPNFGNYPVAGVFTQTSPYTIVDLFAGLTGHHGAWDLGIYAKNVFDTQSETNRVAISNTVYPPYAAAASGYDQIAVTQPREVGVTVRYAFGSR